MSEDDKDENEDFPEFLGGGLAKFYEFMTGFVKFSRKLITATGIASENIFRKPDAAWATVKYMEEKAKECEYEEKQAAFDSARAAVKSLPSDIFAWRIKDNIASFDSHCIFTEETFSRRTKLHNCDTTSMYIVLDVDMKTTWTDVRKNVCQKSTLTDLHETIHGTACGMYAMCLKQLSSYGCPS